eukprot:530763_1
MLSNEFQSTNIYSTHLIGKWHLGFQSWEYTPTYRGFDSFYGYWTAKNDYWTHEATTHIAGEWKEALVTAFDLHQNELPSNKYDNIYGLDWQKQEILSLLKEKKEDSTKKPFFIYFAVQGSHDPRQAPQEYVEIYVDGTDKGNLDRITFKAQTHCVDDMMNEIITYIKDNGLWDNTLIIFGSDNGGFYRVGDNSPYRGVKKTSWEGGIKVPAFITGGVLNDDRRGKRFDYLMHITDWYQTLLSVAGLDVHYERSKRLYDVNDEIKDNRWDNTKEIELDGINMWDYIQGIKEDDKYFEYKRETLLDLKDGGCDLESCGALRIGRYKYIRGNTVT